MFEPQDPVTEKDEDSNLEDLRRAALAGWVMQHIDPWRRWRDQQFGKKWGEYYRLWRGFWAVEDKNRDSERSQLISPALQQAVEMTVAEMEEATFGRGEWIDICEDYEGEEKEKATQIRDALLDDLEKADVPSGICEAYVNGALYGTAIGKVMIGRYAQGPMAGKFRVWLEPVAPQNFVIDPSARSVDEALGCAHEIGVPKHRILSKQKSEVYYKTPVGSWNGEHQMFDLSGKSFSKDLDNTDTVYITEYHGLIPKKYLKGNFSSKNADDEQFTIKDKDGTPLLDDGDLVEAIVTIANKGILLRDVENPYTNQDRAIVAYQHETVPNQFWGRGVSEKGYNPQKALDAELRARMDALGLLTYPVMGADATKLPPGLDLKVRPGRLFLLNGRPSEILEPITFGNLDPANFQNTADLERMVQMGTGAMDSATPLDSNRRNETSSGMSMQFSGFIKRSKRTMQNVERQFLTKFVQKALWRYMQYDPDQYPTDFEFVVKSSMGIMAREIEQSILAQLIQVVPPESPLFMVVIKGIIDNGASPNKAQMMAAIDKMMQPDPKKQQIQDQMQQIQLSTAHWTSEKLRGQAMQAMSAAQLNQSNAQAGMIKAQVEPLYAQAQAASAVTSAKQADIQQQQMHHQHFETLLESHHKNADRNLERDKIKSQEKVAAMKPAPASKGKSKK